VFLDGSRARNLLTALHKWLRRQDENFVTEAFAHLLWHLQNNEPDAFVRLLNHLTGPETQHRVEQPQTATITAQVHKGERGQPDIEIRTAWHVVYVEVKVQSGVRWQQLVRYRRALDDEWPAKKTLVLLTRYPVSKDDEGGEPDWSLRWYDVGEKLVELLASNMLSDSVSAYLTRQFVEFLQERGIVMEHVDAVLKPGIRALWNLMGMLEEALRGTNALGAPSFGRHFGGYWVNGKDAWAGVTWKEPTTLWINTEELQFDPATAASLPGFVDKRTSASDSHRWNMKLDLEGEGFFDLSRSDQMERIEAFVAEGIECLMKLNGRSGSRNLVG
jgi:hypothetical protein